MTTLREPAYAKLNLTLEVLGRRADGYHELSSLVAFAELGDVVDLAPGPTLELVVEGPFAEALTGGGNLILDAARAAKTLRLNLELGRFRLTKNLPIAAGLGGGSADAAAALRLLARANGVALTGEHLAMLAAELGSDVRVCLASQPALMTGRGETVHPLRNFPACGVVLANPGVALTAPAVYGALKAPPISGDRESIPEVPDFAGSFERLLDYAGPRGNDLEAPAIALAPVIKEVLAALAQLKGVRLVSMSGSGSTCFALFVNAEEARRGAGELIASHPGWWVAASTLACDAGAIL
ncbi:MAG: 4-(cytidine 5'-diphospho)-2-C-methyl-D-erythritol kinase [Methyloceanibacter sp.]